jgi:hypothetical protein
MPRRAQPVPPIFQPEVAADAIVWAATHRRRELWVGWATVKAIVGDKIAPGLVDRYLARVGYDSQQTDESVDQDRPDNLWQPLAGDAGAHGRFDQRARDHSWQLWATTHRAVVLGSVALGGVSGRFNLNAGQRVWFSLSDMRERDTPNPEASLDYTLSYWREWSKRCTYVGPYLDDVRRSALALKLLTFEPTGALIAAPTTSLPEEIGGVRNWDYRYAWLRDSALILYALQSIGYHEEALDFFKWLESICLACQDTIQVLYRLDGGRDLAEQVLPHLEGYRGSRPVRIGNAAARQRQLDIYGEVLDAAHLCYEGPKVWIPDCGRCCRCLPTARQPDGRSRTMASGRCGPARGILCTRSFSVGWRWIGLYALPKRIRCRVTSPAGVARETRSATRFSLAVTTHHSKPSRRRSTAPSSMPARSFCRSSASCRPPILACGRQSTPSRNI